MKEFLEKTKKKILKKRMEPGYQKTVAEKHINNKVLSAEKTKEIKGVPLNSLIGNKEEIYRVAEQLKKSGFEEHSKILKLGLSYNSVPLWYDKNYYQKTFEATKKEVLDDLKEESEKIVKKINLEQKEYQKRNLISQKIKKKEFQTKQRDLKMLLDELEEKQQEENTQTKTKINELFIEKCSKDGLLSGGVRFLEKTKSKTGNENTIPFKTEKINILRAFEKKQAEMTLN